MPKPTKARVGRPPAGRVKTMLSLDPVHLDALREEAARRAKAAGRLNPDASAVVRDVLDDWMKRRAKTGR